MTTEPSHDSAQVFLHHADEMLVAARLLFDHGLIGSAADRAYYAMYNAATAALTLAPVILPKSHSGLATIFSREFIRDGPFEPSFASDLGTAFRIRQDATYEPDRPIERDEVAEIIN